MGALSDRPYSPVLLAATTANQTPLNVQGGQPGPLPALQSLTTANETQIISAFNSAIPLSVALPPDSTNEQTVLDLWWSGYIKLPAASNLTLKLYAGANAVLANNTLLATSGAIAQAAAGTNAFWAHLKMIYDSISGVLAGTSDFYIARQFVASATLANFPGGFLNQGNPSANPPTVANLPTFSITAQSSTATAGAPTVINTQKFSCG